MRTMCPVRTPVPTGRKVNFGRPPRDRLSHILFLSAGLYTRELKFCIFALANHIFINCYYGAR